MSILDSLFSVSGAITLSIGSILAIRQFRVIVSIKNGGVSINGNNNVIGGRNVIGDNNFVIYSELPKEIKWKNSIIWKLALAVMGVLYPEFGWLLNKSIFSLSLVFAAFSLLLSFCLIWRVGWRSISGFVSFLGSMAVLWAVYTAEPFLVRTAGSASQDFKNYGILISWLVTEIQYGSNLFSAIYYLLPSTAQILFKVLNIFGFLIMLNSALQLGLYFYKIMDLDDTAKFFLKHILLTFCGYSLSCDLVKAFCFGNLEYVLYIYSKLLSIY